MDSKKDVEKQVAIAARENGVSSVLLRNAIDRKLCLNIADMECLGLFLLRVSQPLQN